MLFTPVYVFNLLCSIVPCQASMRPPEAHIARNYQSSANNNLSASTIDLALNNSLDPVTGDFSNDVLTIVRPKRVENETESVIGSSTPPPSTKLAAQGIRRYPNLLNPVRTLIEAVRKGVQQSGGLTHNFGNPLVPFPDPLPGNIKRDVQAHNKQNEVQGKETMVYLRNGDAVEGYFMGTMKGRRILAFQGIWYSIFG